MSKVELPSRDIYTEPQKSQTTSSSVTILQSNRNVSSSYLDLTPLPENELVDATMPTISSNHHANNADSHGVKSTHEWNEAKEMIRKNLHERLPSASSHEMRRSSSVTFSPSTKNRPTQRPSTAPVGASRTYGGESQSLRSARYLALQWRSRATQWSSTSSLGTDQRSSLHDSMSSSSPPPALAEADEYDSESSSSSETSYKSTASLDESTKSHISDAKSVVDVWKDRALSMLLHNGPSDATPTNVASTQSQESAKTVKARGGRRSVDNGYDDEYQEVLEETYPAPSNEAFNFALRPATVPAKLKVRSLLRANKRPITPLQRISSGQEYQSSSQKLLQRYGSDSEIMAENDRNTLTNEENENRYHNAKILNEMSNSNLSVTSDHFSSTLSSIDGESSTLHNVSLDGEESHDILQPMTSPSSHSSASNDESFTTANSHQESLGPRSYPDQTDGGTETDLDQSNHLSKPLISTFVKPSISREQLATPVYTKEEIREIISPPHPRKPVISTFMKPMNSDDRMDSTSSSKSNEAKDGLEKRYLIPSIKEREEKAKKERAEKAANFRREGASKDSVQARLEAAKSSRSGLVKQNLRKQRSFNSLKVTNVKSQKTVAKKVSNTSVKMTNSQSTSATSSKIHATLKQPLKWKTHDVTFTFSILTSSNDAPPVGVHGEEDGPSYKNKLVTRSKLLHEVMNRFILVTRRIKRLGNGKYMIDPSSVPSITHVGRDRNYAVPSRPGVVRSIVKAFVPILIPNGDGRAANSATFIIRKTFKKSLDNGEFDDFKKE